MPVAVSDLRGSRVRAKCDLTTRLLYTEILHSLWEHNGAIPADLDFLEDDLNMPREEIERGLPLLLKIGRHGRGGLQLGEDGKLRNARVTEDLAEALAFKLAQAERGRKGGLRSAERRSDSAEPYSRTAEAPLHQRSTTDQAAASDPQASYPFPSSSHSPPPCVKEAPSELAPPSARAEAPLAVFPCIAGKKSASNEWGLMPSQVAEWQEVYIGIDVAAEARKALAWVKANPANRKTYGKMASFLVNWLGRAQNNAGSGRNGKNGYGGGVWSPGGRVQISTGLTPELEERGRILTEHAAQLELDAASGNLPPVRPEDYF